MITVIRIVAPFLGAISIAFIAYWLVSAIRIESSATRQLANFQGERKLDAGERFGEQVAGKLPISIGAWQDHLKWAQRGGYFLDWGIGRMVFQALLYAAIAALIILLLKPVPLLILAAVVMGLAYPFMGVRGKANKTRKQVVRSLPEVAALTAAEVAAGTPAEQAINRAAQLPGPLSGLLGEAIAHSQQTGRPLFSRKPVKGTLVEVFQQANLPILRAFATQLDLVSLKGVAGAALMSEIAASMSREYRSRVMSDTKKLDSKLVMATAFFFFIPFVIIILGSFMTPILQMFG